MWDWAETAKTASAAAGPTGAAGDGGVRRGGRGGGWAPGAQGDRGPELGLGGQALTRFDPGWPWIPGLYSSSVSGAHGSRRSWMTRPGEGMGPQATSPLSVPLP